MPYVPRLTLPRMSHLRSFALNRKRLPKIITASVASLLLIIILNTCASNARLARAADAAKQNGHAIQLAVERYSTDDPNGNYPASLSQIIGTSYLPDMPLNEFSGVFRAWPTLEHRRKMRVLGIGEYCPGDVVYIPIYYENGRDIASYSIIVPMMANPRRAGIPLNIAPTPPIVTSEQSYAIASAYQIGP
jgi:hypothetical protein